MAEEWHHGCWKEADMVMQNLHFTESLIQQFSQNNCYSLKKTPNPNMVTWLSQLLHHAMNNLTTEYSVAEML